MPEITEADIAAVARLKEKRGECRDEAEMTTMLQVAFAAHREAERERIVANLNAHVEVLLKKNAAYAAVGLQDYIDEIKQVATTTPPEPRPLTAEIVREILPANKSPVIQPGFPHAFYESPLGAIGWWHDGDEIRFQIGDRIVSLATIGTDRKLAEIVAALGISEGVKHG